MSGIGFEAVVDFHGHACPGLALGYRVACRAVDEMGGERPADEELVAIVENNSCAVDAIQAVAGCTFGKGNLIFKDHGKQVYTFFRRGGEVKEKALRISVVFQPPAESEAERLAWQRYYGGERDAATTAMVAACKKRKMESILNADDAVLLSVSRVQMEAPPVARIHPAKVCSRCGEKVMATRAVAVGGEVCCLPCSAG